MKRMDGLVGLLWLFLTVGAGIGLVWGALQLGLGDLINPSPEQVAEQLVRGVGAHRFEGAMQTLSEPLQESVNPALLRTLAVSIELASGGIEDVNGVSAEETGDTAEAQVLVSLSNRTEVTLSIPLTKENGEWKVASVEPLWQLAQATQTIRLMDL